MRVGILCSNYHVWVNDSLRLSSLIIDNNISDRIIFSNDDCFSHEIFCQVGHIKVAFFSILELKQKASSA